MGKKNRIMNAKATELRIKKLCDELIQLCSTKPNPSENVSLFISMQRITKELINLQKDSNLVNKFLPKKREPHLMQLLEHYKASLVHSIAICSDLKSGFGLQSLECLHKNDCIMELPLASVFSTDRVSSPLPQFLKSDSLFSGMPNVALSLALLHEVSLGEGSNWHEYICALPLTYTTAAYFTESDLCLISGFEAADAVVNAFRNICRQYAYLYLLFQKMCTQEILPGYMKTFCFEDYRWATATVMSRNNWLPQSGDPGEKVLHLIPLWDMINHRLGEVTTDCDFMSEKLIFYSMESYEPGEEIFMDYGPRSSTEFLLYNGFVPDINPYHKVPIKLGLSKFDKLFNLRNRLLGHLGFQNQISASLSYPNRALPPPELLSFARVFVMNENELHQTDLEIANLTNNSSSFLLSSKLTDSRIDREAGKFLENRYNLLIKVAESRMENNLKSPDGKPVTLSIIGKHCICACRHDIDVLSKCLAFLAQ